MPNRQVYYIEDPGYQRRLLDELEYRRTTAKAQAGTMSPQVAQRIGQIAETYPNLPPNVVYAAIKANLNDEQVNALARRQAEVDSEEPGMLEQFGNVVTWPFRQAADFLKPGVRAATTAFKTATDETLLRGYRSIAGASDIASRNVQGPEFGDNLLADIGETAATILSPRFAGEVARNIPGQYAQAGASEGTLAVRNLLQGEPVDLGSGFFPGGELAEESRQQRNRVRISGQPATIGHQLGQALHAATPENVELFEPGSTSFNVVQGISDLAFEIAGDPAGAGLGAASKIRHARNTFGVTAELAPNIRRALEAGGVVGARKTTLVDEFAEWLGREGGDAVGWLADTDDPAAIWRATRGSLQPDFVKTVAGVADEGEVSRLLLDQVERGLLRDRRFYTGEARVAWRRWTDSRRVFNDMPGHELPLDDLQTRVEEVDRLAANVKMPMEARDNIVRRMLDTDDNDVQGIWDVLRDTMGDIEDHLTEGGVRHSLARDATRIVRDFDEDLRLYAIDRHGDPIAFPGSRTRVFQDGTEKTIETPMFLSQYLRSIRMPDAESIRDMRRLSARYDTIRDVYTSKGWDVTTTFGTAFMQKLWKPLQLLRVAWLARVIPEEQVRMGAEGLDSAFRHPIRYVGWLIGEKGRVDLLDNPIEAMESFHAAMSRRGAAFRDVWDEAGRTSADAWVRLHKDSTPAEQMLDAWRRNLTQLAGDEVGARVAGGMFDGDEFDDTLQGLDAVKDWFWNGSGKSVRERLMVGTNPEKAALAQRANADAYIEQAHRAVREVTGDNPELLQALHGGELNGVDLFARRSRKVVDELDGYWDSMPDVVRGEKFVDVRSSSDKAIRFMDRAVDAAFEYSMGTVSDAASRGPAYRQMFWRNVEELIPYATDDLQKALIKSAGDAGMSKATLKSMARKATQSSGGKLDNLEDANLMAHARAHDETKKLLYDLSKRGQFADATRLVFPFAEAWKEILTSWGRIAARHPQQLRKGQILVENARDSGVFYTDESTGEEMFAYPGGSLISKALGFGPGGGIKLEGRVAGLNLVSASVIPGFGPGIQWAASAFLPQSPDADWLREILLPYGEAETDTPGALLNDIIPAYGQKLLQAWSEGGIDPVSWNNTVGDVARVLTASGEYRLDTEEHFRRTMEDAAKKGRLVYAIRGLLQSGLPTGPSIKYEAADEEGRWHSLETLANEFRDIRSVTADDHEAWTKFYDKYGLDPWFISQPKSKSLRERAVTETGAEWERRHADLVEEFPLTVGYFAPEPEGDRFDYTAWRRTIESGERQALTAEQQGWLARASAAWMAYNHARRKVEQANLSDDQKTAYLSAVRADLEEEAPGWREPSRSAEVPEGASFEMELNELREAAANPTIAATPAGKALGIYLRKRDEVYEQVAARGYKTLSGKNVADLRAYLRSVGSALLKDHPQFAGLWHKVFSGEVRESIEEQEAA